MTGSSAGLRRLIQRLAADTLTPSIFELGGKSPNIVLRRLPTWTLAAFGRDDPSIYTFNAGQHAWRCSRFLVQRPVLDEMLPNASRRSRESSRSATRSIRRP